MSSKVLVLEDLVVAFETETGEIHAVDSVGFELEKGSTLGIVGESGCGKSVTALSIMRLLPRPSARILRGRALYKGNDIFRMVPADLNRFRGRDISMIFQEPMTALNPVHNIGRQIMEIYRWHFVEMSRRQMVKSAILMLEKVGIADPEKVMDKYPHQLSGGMRQRVMIAIALAAEPEILIADEPTTALDVTVQAQILELIKTLQAEIGMSVILITHDLGVIAQNCDETVVMYAGRIAEKAMVRDLFKYPCHPYTKGLLSSMPSRGAVPKTILPTIRGNVPSLFDMPEGCRFSARCPEAKTICRQACPPEQLMGDRHSAVCHFP